MTILNNEILKTRLKIDKFQKKELHLLNLNNTFIYLNSKYSFLSIEKHKSKYYFIANLDFVENKKPYLIKDKYNQTISYYEKIQDSQFDCFIYSILPIYGTKLIEFSPPDNWSYRDHSLYIYSDFFEILKKRKSLIKKVQNFIIEKVSNYPQTKIIDLSNSDKVKDFIDNLIFT